MYLAYIFKSILFKSWLEQAKQLNVLHIQQKSAAAPLFFIYIVGF